MSIDIETAQRELCRRINADFFALPPGWRFLIADGYEDVWFDDLLSNVGK